MVRQAGRLALAALAFFVMPLLAYAETPSDQLAQLAKQVDTAVERLDAGDQAGARSAYQRFDDGWFNVEDGVRDASRASYRSIESAMTEAQLSLRADPFDGAKAKAALLALR